MLGKKKTNYQNIESLVSQGVEIKGEINSRGSIRIDGNVEGTLRIEGDLVIGETAKVKGDVKVDNVILAGNLEGNVSAKGRLEINATGVMSGDASCTVIVIEEGGVLEGTSKMSRAKEKDNAEKINPLKKSS